MVPADAVKPAAGPESQSARPGELHSAFGSQHPDQASGRRGVFPDSGLSVGRAERQLALRSLAPGPITAAEISCRPAQTARPLEQNQISADLADNTFSRTQTTHFRRNIGDHAFGRLAAGFRPVETRA